MFSYYGSKSKIVHLYPTPKFDKIIEPFAGSARYSLKHWTKDVLLIDKYEIVVNIWNWLKQCNENDIKKLPILKRGDNLKNYAYLAEIEKQFLGFLIQEAQGQPRNSV